MSKRVINIELTEASIDSAIKQIEEYKAELLRKCNLLVEELAKQGVSTAKQAVSGTEYGSYITFSMEVSQSGSNVVAVMLATNNGIIKSEWLQRDGSTKVADVSPLLMAEFGSGRYAQNPKAVEGMGRGTFPGQTHADQVGWWYATGTPEHKVWHYTGGVVPTQPMFKASQHIISIISQTARKVFNE